MRKIISFLVILCLFSLSFCCIFYYKIDNFVGMALLLGAPLLYTAYLFELSKGKEPSIAVLFLISFLSMLLMNVPFMGSGFGAETFYPMLLISLFVLSLCFSSGFFAFGDNRNLFAVLMGDTLGFGLVIFGILLNHSKHWELHIFAILFYVAAILGFLVSKLFRNQSSTS